MSLRELNAAVQNSTFPSHEFAQAVREWISAATERMEPEPAKACPRCLQLTSAPHHRLSSKNLCPEWTCLPVSFDDNQPRPATPSEMPRAVLVAVNRLRLEADGYQSCEDYNIAKQLQREAKDLEAWWRSQSAPAVRMAEKLKRKLSAFTAACDSYLTGSKT